MLGDAFFISAIRLNLFGLLRFSINFLGFDCLSKQDGTIVMLNYTSVKIDGETKHFCSPICDTTIASIEKYDNDIWTDIQGFSNCKDKKSGYSYIAGEGGMGNEGFIVCLDDKECPVWSLFFTDSNPFYKLEVRDGRIEAVSSQDLKFSIDLNSPEKIEISQFELIM